jgi:uncharacterized membrane protein (DUF485 family)
MKKFNYFFLEMKLWKVWLINMIFIGLISYIMGNLINMSLNTRSGFIQSFSIFMGIMFGTMITGVMYLTRAADKFYREADEIEELAKKATTKNEIYDLWHGRLVPLKDKSFHRHTGVRVRELAAMMQARHELLP